MPRIDGLPVSFTFGLIAGILFALFRRGSETGDKTPFSGK